MIGYALVTLKDAAAFHPDFKTMIDNFKSISYKGKPLFSYKFYCMGQVCIDKAYRGKGVFTMLYQKHKEMYSQRYQVLLTEISANNTRSQKAHEKVGFKTFHTYDDALDTWNVVALDLK